MLLLPKSADGMNRAVPAVQRGLKTWEAVTLHFPACRPSLESKPLVHWRRPRRGATRNGWVPVTWSCIRRLIFPATCLWTLEDTDVIHKGTDESPIFHCNKSTIQYESDFISSTNSCERITSVEVLLVMTEAGQYNLRMNWYLHFHFCCYFLQRYLKSALYQPGHTMARWISVSLLCIGFLCWGGKNLPWYWEHMLLIISLMMKVPGAMHRK